MFRPTLRNARRAAGARPRLMRALGTAVLAAAIGMAAAWGAARPLENALQNLGFAMRAAPASGQVHVVEMDAASVAAIRRWPWDREHYARVVDRLDRAGVRSIAFDVDFSTPSTPAQDARFGRSLAQAKANIVLPVFGQRAGFGDARQLDSLPIPELRDHGALGSVSVGPGSDGIVRDMPIGTLNAGAPRPSLSAQVAQRSGEAGTDFPIDYAIRPGTLPRHSFVAVERGEFDAADLRGKDVIIGATAIEMGDRYAVPMHGVLPGVTIQALAAETLLTGVPARIGWVTPLVLASLLAYWILAAPVRSWIALRTAAAAATLLAVLHFGAVLFDRHITIAPALLAVIAAAGIRWTALIRRAFEEARMIDPESGLPNRRALERRVGAGSGQRVIAVMIDEFDAVKMVIGQQAVGALVQRLRDRLQAGACGEFDGDDSGEAIGTIYRIEDRALAWISPLEPFELEAQLQGLAAIMRHPVEVAGRRVNVMVAFGIAVDREQGDALHAASLALKRGSPFAYHEQAERIVLEQQLSLMSELEGAIRNGELSVLYQPKLDLRTDRISSAEALVRWHHPTRGHLRPDLFIPLAEEANRIDELTVFVLCRAIEDLNRWCADGTVMKVAVNISAGLIASSAFTSRIEHILRDADLPRGRLIFEVTESATIGRFEQARAALQRFRDMGVSISMDDYGTGQSTLSYLKSLPLNELKIDRSFVQHVHRDRNDALLVGSTVELAHQLGLEVVAEGIEDADCLAFLRSIGCDYAQGYYIGRPMDAPSLLALASEQLQQAA